MTIAVIADDSVLLRTALQQLLRSEGITVPAAVGDAAALTRAVDAHRPDIAIIDIRMPPTFTTEGVRAAVSLRRDHPGLGVLLLSQHVERHEVLAVLTSTAAGGVGYLLKDRVSDVDGFLDQVRAVASGGTAIDPLIVQRVLSRRDTATTLTPRERDILSLMAQGRSNAGIAADLTLGERTVEAHIRAIFTKLALPDESDVNRRVLAVLQHLSP
jgi:DNA-binding NarL/FixJ family response regulator